MDTYRRRKLRGVRRCVVADFAEEDAALKLVDQAGPVALLPTWHFRIGLGQFLASTNANSTGAFGCAHRLQPLACPISIRPEPLGEIGGLGGWDVQTLPPWR